MSQERGIMPLIPFAKAIKALLLCAIIFAFAIPAGSNLIAQNWSDIPILDGDLRNNEWLPINPNVGPAGFDNVLWIYDISFNEGGIWKSGGSATPPGVCHGEDENPGVFDPPLDWEKINPAALELNVASGFNLWGLGVNWHPEHQRGTYFLAFDLPGSTNTNMSDTYTNGNVGAIPVAWDADGDGDATNAVLPPYIADTDVKDDGQEAYNIDLYLGNTTPIGTSPNGLQLSVRLESTNGNPSNVTLSVFIPGTYTTSGLDLVLHNKPFYSGAFNYAGGGSTAGTYDIEVKISQIFDIIGEGAIDWTKVAATPGSQKFTPADVQKGRIVVAAGAVLDISAEETFSLNYEFGEDLQDYFLSKTVRKSAASLNPNFNFNEGNPSWEEVTLTRGAGESAYFQIAIHNPSSNLFAIGNITLEDAIFDTYPPATHSGTPWTSSLNVPGPILPGDDLVIGVYELSELAGPPTDYTNTVEITEIWAMVETGSGYVPKFQLENDENDAKVKFKINGGGEEIPALSTIGILLMALVLGGLIIFRIVRMS